MRILITGANGFIGKNLILQLQNRGYNDLCFCTRDTSMNALEELASDCDFVFHLAGVNRPDNQGAFTEENVEFTSKLLATLKKYESKTPILFSSSTQAMQDNAYGKSKLAAEELLLDYQNETKANVFVYRLSNVFGKWCRPNYNSVVATFCHNIANNIPIQINDEAANLNLIYIDDVVEEFINAMEGVDIKSAQDGRYYIHAVHSITLGKLANLIRSFRESRSSLQAPDMSEGFTKKLYSTYLTYLPEDKFSYPIKMNVDNRGSFTEILKADSFGQISVNISKPGITKGNHWHHTKTEKFLVISGEGVIRFRKVSPEIFKAEEEKSSLTDIKVDAKTIEYKVSGEKLEVIDIPPGYTHNITNLGTNDMVTIMWANESFNKDKPDTYFLEV